MTGKLCDTEQTPRSLASDLNIHCSLRPVCQSTSGKYFSLIDTLLKETTLLTHLCLATHKRTLTSSEDPDQTPQNAASDQGLHGLH